ncbi:TraB/GumN family protein [Epibacterium sp. SM1979]|uniref:TraB/GumN family protein n=1 Tax=Tritonibacter litoralis TaxID=2662264 RepID=A0A843YFV8_9RHOB|nr:TraB/GumN family protein [Tritonibacter litoralis]MQQ07999.1 TraB/GumN family protein [Tritonibacter litoralis]
MKRFLLGLAIALQSTAAIAACKGVDYRDHLPASVATRLEQQMAKTPFAVGNHWVARKGEKTLHIVGTMHSGDRRMAEVMRNLRPTIAAADAVYFEVTAREVTAFREDFIKNRAAFLLPNQATLKQVMSKTGWEQFRDFASVTGLNLKAVERLQPWAISTFLVQNGCRPTGIGVRRGLDDRIEKFAIRKKIPIGALESVETSLQAMARIPVRDQAKILENDIALLMSDRPDDATATEAYFDESVWQAFLLLPWITQQYVDRSPRELQRLNTVFNESLLGWRNRKWMRPLLNVQGDTVVVAVGSAHLPGKSGILNLLKQNGYTLERAAF